MRRFAPICLSLCVVAAMAAYGTSIATRHTALPRVWMSTVLRDDMDEAIRMCAEQGVDCVEVPSWGAEGCARHLAALRRYGVRGFTSCGYDPSEDCRPAVRDGKPCERAVFNGGAYRGLAIDRNVFHFSAGPHEIIVEPPVYSRHQPYAKRVKDLDGSERIVRSGHYFNGFRPTGKAEVIVPEKLFDGAQHLRILPCYLLPADPDERPENDTAAALSGPDIDNRRLVKLRFDLTGCGDCLLDKVGIAVYWESDPDGADWKKGVGMLSVFSELTCVQARELGKWRSKMWADANGGTFPSGEIVAIRFGDECFNITGWLDAPACSFPLWGFSESGRAAFEAAACGAVGAAPRPLQPRTWGFPELYGAEAYGIALYEYHRAAAALVRAFREGVREITPDLLVFRNTTRGGVWAEANDHDGSGQELLTRELDFLNPDPYPVNVRGYDAEYIPRDMGYVAGLARRFGKPLVPWLQGHAYIPTGLGDITPADMDRMWAQHLPFHPAGMMWLGFDAHPGNTGTEMTFPKRSPESWAYAKKLFAEVHGDFAETRNSVNPVSGCRDSGTSGSREARDAVPAPLAIVRPYATRAICCSLGDGRWRNPADRILEAFAMAWGVDNGLQYDIFELPPGFDGAAPAVPEELSRYPLVVSTMPLPGVTNVRVLGDGTEGTTISSGELIAMRKAFAEEIAAGDKPQGRFDYCARKGQN